MARVKKYPSVRPEDGSSRLALNDGPSTPVRNYGGKILPNSGGGRIGKVRLKPGVTVKDVYR